MCVKVYSRLPALSLFFQIIFFAGVCFRYRCVGVCLSSAKFCWFACASLIHKSNFSSYLLSSCALKSSVELVPSVFLYLSLTEVFTVVEGRTSEVGGCRDK